MSVGVQRREVVPRIEASHRFAILLGPKCFADQVRAFVSEAAKAAWDCAFFILCFGHSVRPWRTCLREPTRGSRSPTVARATDTRPRLPAHRQAYKDRAARQWRYVLLAALAMGSYPASADVAFDAFTAITPGVNPSGTHTPSGTPDCVLILAATNVADTPTVTYGASSMGSPIASQDVVNAAEITDFLFKAWLLASGVPSGAQTVTMSNANNGSTLHVYTLTTAANACELITSAGDDDLTISNVAATLTLGGRTVFAALVGASGEDAVTSTTPLTNWNNRNEVDNGAFISLGYSYDIIGSTNITAGWTQTSDDAAFLAAAVSEVVSGSTQPPRTMHQFRMRRQ